MFSQPVTFINELPVPDFDWEADIEEEEDAGFDTDAGLPYITINELNRRREEGEKVKIFDCRFPYEYEAGHIPNAINSNSPTNLFKELFENPSKKTLIVFHCEFSQSRGPTMASLFRDHDRDLNSNRYPFLYYPEVYILDGGFKSFYEEHPSYCVGSYCRMHSDENINNGNLQHYNSLFKDEVEKVHEAKRGNLIKDSLLCSKSQTCPISPISHQNSLERKRSVLLASPVPLKKRVV